MLLAKLRRKMGLCSKITIKRQDIIPVHVIERIPLASESFYRSV